MATKIYTEQDVATILTRVALLEDAIQTVLNGTPIDLEERQEDGLNFAIWLKKVKLSDLQRWQTVLQEVL